MSTTPSLTMATTPIYAFDIEATALVVTEGRLRSIAICGPGVQMVSLVDDRGDEAETIAGTLAWLGAQARGIVVGWNSSGYDVPWLLGRAAAGGIDLAARGLLNTYPDAARALKYTASDHTGMAYTTRAVGGHRHADIAEAWRGLAEDAGVSWGLKPVARWQGLAPLEEDRTAITALSPERLIAYNLSDVRVTRELALRLGDDLARWVD